MSCLSNSSSRFVLIGRPGSVTAASHAPARHRASIASRDYQYNMPAVRSSDAGLAGPALWAGGTTGRPAAHRPQPFGVDRDANSKRARIPWFRRSPSSDLSDESPDTGRGSLVAEPGRGRARPEAARCPGRPPLTWEWGRSLAGMPPLFARSSQTARFNSLRNFSASRRTWSASLGSMMLLMRVGVGMRQGHVFLGSMKWWIGGQRAQLATARRSAATG